MSRIACILLLVLAMGCTTESVPKLPQPSNPFTKNKPKSPARMVDMWNTYAQTNPNGGKPLRGLGGRIQFFQDGNKDPVKVDGRISIFVFDGEEKDPRHAKPLLQYVVPAETLDAHYNKKEPLGGHGYDFFLALDEADGEERTLCVMARFDDAIKGEWIISKPVITVLQGTPRSGPERMYAGNDPGGVPGNNGTAADVAGGVAQANGSSIRQVAHAQALEEEVQRLRKALEESRHEELERRRVAAIPLTENFSRQMGLPANKTLPAGSNIDGAEAMLAMSGFGQDVAQQQTRQQMQQQFQQSQRNSDTASSQDMAGITSQGGARLASRQYPNVVYPATNFPNPTVPSAQYPEFSAGEVPESPGTAEPSVHPGAGQSPVSSWPPAGQVVPGVPNPPYLESRSPLPPAQVQYRP